MSIDRIQTVLLVDDNALQLKLNARRLGDAGYRVLCAHGGDEALALAQLVVPDAIVSDVVMGDLDGFALCQRLRQNRGFDAVPIVLISSHVDDEEGLQLARRSGASALIARSGEFEAELAALRASLAPGVRPAAEPEASLEAAHLRCLTYQLSSVAARASASETRYRELVERLPGVVWSADFEGHFTFVSTNVEKMIGFSADEVLAGGRPLWSSRVHPDDDPTVRAARQRFDACEGSCNFDLQYRFQRKDGAWIWLRNRSSSICQQGSQRFCDGIFTDVTHERQLEESLRQAQKLEAVGLLAGGIAHDFNNILAVIVASATFLAEELDAADVRRQDAVEVLQMARRAAALTRQLLAFSRREVAEPETFAADECLGELGKMLTRLIGEDVELTLPPHLGAPALVRLDRGHFEQIVVNLVVNARDAMPRGGHLSVATGAADVPAGFAGVRTGTLPAGRYSTLSVVDDGEGIDPAIAARIFEPFFTTKGPGKGTGLGLSTVYGIVQQAGGGIAVDSQPGQGTTFTVYLPHVAEVAAPAPAAAAERALPAVPGTILLVEDEELVRSACRRILASAGYRVVEAKNGDEALALIAADGTGVQLVLTDVVMPQVNGPDLVSALRLARPELKVLYMSGYSEHPVLKADMVEASTDFIHKPFAPDALLKKVRHALAA